MAGAPAGAGGLDSLWRVRDGRGQQRRTQDRALKRIKKKRDFLAHVVTYVLVNSFLVVIWAATGAGYFWPIFPIAGWGIGLALHAWDIYRSEPSEEEIRKEMERLK